MTTDRPSAEPGTQRIEAFSDGVFAIAITLLIIEIGVPLIESGESLGEALLELWPSYGAYVLSFTTIGIYWANHHAYFKLFLRTDHVFLMINVFFLMSIAFLPFPTAVLAEYLQEEDQRQTAATLYTAGLLFPAFAWLSIWLYASIGKRLTDPRLDPAYVRSLTAQYLFSNAVFGAAVIASFWSPITALSICVGFTLLYLLPPRRPRYVGSG